MIDEGTIYELQLTEEELVLILSSLDEWETYKDSKKAGILHSKLYKILDNPTHLCTPPTSTQSST